MTYHIWHANKIEIPEIYQETLKNTPYHLHELGIYFIALSKVMDDYLGLSSIRVYNSDDKGCCIDVNDESLLFNNRPGINLFLGPVS